ncbi:YcxB family protein [Persicirhabdus sediminis]|uniref:YcxB family protein n=2 Tax=Persicirhabdus sediminis TaxID=454144 RepID=A0A8J7MBP2_9BACT|nr:YcxB family protein [Persicirhabdus sediminis]
MIQIPICTAILYFVAKAFLTMPYSSVKKSALKESEDTWGKRTVSIAEDGITIIGSKGDKKYDLNEIDNLSETENNIFIRKGKKSLIILPKSAFSLKEIKHALLQFGRKV